jgi:polyisoprenyl-phosphate glycosyltransferase
LHVDHRQLLSVVVPVYGSAPILLETHRRLTEALSPLDGLDYEIVYVNDGSPDGAGEILRGIVARDRRARLIWLSRNFGHQAAITAGLDHAAGDAVVIIDDDLQDPPEVIGQMVDLWRQGNQVVYGTRAVRRGDSTFKRASAKVFYRLLQWLSDRPIPLDTGDFRLLDRSVVDVLRQMREESRYMRGMVSWVGFRQCALTYERDARFTGESNYSLRTSFRLALNGIVSFSTRPLLLSAAFGSLVTLGAFLAMLWLIIGKLVNPGSVVAGTTTVLVAVLFMGGIQLVTIGVLGTYLGKVFYETKKRPLYVAAELLGFGEAAPATEGTGSLGAKAVVRDDATTSVD